MTVIYHNPACSTSRRVLAILRENGEEPEVVEYLKTPPDRATIQKLVADAGLILRDALRRKDALYSELGLDDPGVSDAQLLDAVEAHPALLQRPFVVSARGTRLCRPVEAVHEIMASPPTG